MSSSKIDLWPNRKLGEFLQIKHGYAFKGEYFSEEGPYIVLTPGNFYDEGGFKYKSQEKYYVGQIPESFILNRYDLIIAMTEQKEGLLGSSVIVPKNDYYLHNQRLGLIVDLKESELDKIFLYYIFNSQPVRAQIQASANGAKVRHTSPSRIYEVIIKVPPIQTQKKIAAILSAYDDLIENNNRRIKILEEMAQALYREWFVEFRFPGHEDVKMVEVDGKVVPEGWEVKNINDIAEITYGFPFKSKSFTNEIIGKPVIRIRNIRDSYSATYTPELPHNKYIVNNGDILVGMDGDFHMGKWSGGEAYLNQRVVRFRPKDGYSDYFVFLSLQDPISHYDRTITGTTVAHLSARDINSINLVIPNKTLLEHINSIFDQFFKLEIDLKLKNKILQQTRDLLLPRLIEGEIDVSDLAISISQEVELSS